MAGSTWTCQICGEEQPATNDKCSCGAPRLTGTPMHGQAANVSVEPPKKRSKWDEGAGAGAGARAGAGMPSGVAHAPESAAQQPALIHKTVAVLGLSSKPELNGMTALVKEFDSAANRYVVEVEGGLLGVFKLKPDNLFQFAIVGKRVEVVGLANRPDLNGEKGIIKEFDTAANRYTVEIIGLGAFKLKAANLQDVAPTPDPQMAAPADTGAPQPGAPQPGAPPPSAMQDPAVPGPFSKSIKIAVHQKGMVIGKGGEHIKKVQQESGASVEIETLPGHPDAPFVLIKGSLQQIEVAERLVHERLSSARKSVMAKVAEAAKNIDLSDASFNQSATQRASNTSWGVQEDGAKDREWQKTSRHESNNWKTQEDGSWKDGSWKDSTQNGNDWETNRSGPWKNDGLWDSGKSGNSTWETQKRDDGPSWNSWKDEDSNTKWNSGKRDDSTWSSGGRDDTGNAEKSDQRHSQRDGDTWNSWSDRKSAWNSKSEDDSWSDHGRSGGKWNTESPGNDTWKAASRESDREGANTKHADSRWNADSGSDSDWRNADWDSQQGGWRREGDR